METKLFSMAVDILMKESEDSVFESEMVRVIISRLLEILEYLTTEE